MASFFKHLYIIDMPKLQGKTGFIEYYTAILAQYFPDKNFADLQQALEYQSTPIAHVNPNNPTQVYHLNASSLLPVTALDPQPGDVVLDGGVWTRFKTSPTAQKGRWREVS